ncbi:MAG: flagellar hook-length control protein FliK [Ignavibacteriales bacterium]
MQEIMAQILKPAANPGQGNAYGINKNKQTQHNHGFGEIMKSIHRNSQKTTSQENVSADNDRVKDCQDKSSKEIHAVKKDLGHKKDKVLDSENSAENTEELDQNQEKLEASNEETKIEGDDVTVAIMAMVVSSQTVPENNDASAQPEALTPAVENIQQAAPNAEVTSVPVQTQESVVAPADNELNSETDGVLVNQAAVSGTAVAVAGETDTKIETGANVSNAVAAVISSNEETKLDPGTASDRETDSKTPDKHDKAGKVEVSVHTKSQGKAAEKTVFVNQNAVKTDGDGPKGKNTNIKDLITMETDRYRGTQNKDGVVTTNTQQTEVVVRTDVELTTLKTGTPTQVKADVVASKVDTQDVIDQIVNKFELVTNGNKSSVTIELKPEFLGKLHINLSLNDGVLTAKFQTDNQQVRHILEGGIGQLKTALESNGIRLEKAEVNVDLNNSGNSQSQYQNHHHNQDNRQQPAKTYWLEQISDPETEYEISAEYEKSFDGGVNYVI